MDSWLVYMVGIIALVGIGVYSTIAKRNLIQLIIGIEVIAKGVTLSFILGGYVQGNEQIAQAITITIILVEVVTTAIAMSLIVLAQRHTGSLNTDDLRKLKG